MTVPERAAIALLEAVLATSDRDVLVGIGDDAAVIAAGDRKLAWTIDTCVENVHFDRRWLSLEDVGWRSFQAAVSDIAAMGGRAIAALSSLALPAGTTRRQVRAIGTGQAAAAAEVACPVVGGNVSAGDVLSVTTTVVGTASRPLLRSGARPGHELWLIGEVGLAAAGLRLLQSDVRWKRAKRARAVCVQAWRHPQAQTALGRRLGRYAASAIDVSDGLGGDCAQLAKASGVRVVIEEDALLSTLRPELGAVADLLGTTPLELALCGGEDYALVATGPERKRAPWMRAIGRVESGVGVVLEASDGTRQPVPQGFEHRG